MATSAETVDPTMTEVEDNEHVVLDDLPVMTKAELQKVALEQGGYATPNLNDTLYLHFKGYRKIENLEEYTGLKTLWLHSNGFAQIENLNHLHELRCLFLQRNALTKLENLHGLSSLVQLDISENNIRTVEGLSQLTNLTTLNLQNNALMDVDSIIHLTQCKELAAVDLSKNQLNGQDIIDCLAGIEKATSLNMAGNPVVSKVAYFRKKLIVACKTLKYLDKPIFEEERLAVEAWAQGGLDAERETKEQLQQAMKEKEGKATKEFRAWQESVRSTQQAMPRRYEVVDGNEATSTPLSSGEEETNEFILPAQPPEEPFIEMLDEEPKEDVLENNEPSGSMAHPSVTAVEAPAEEEDDVPSIIPTLTFQDPEVVEVVEVVEEQEPTFATEIIEKENIQPTEDVQEYEVETSIEVNARRIRDSLVLMKSKKQNSANMSGILWTSSTDRQLLKLAEAHSHDFDMVASSMAEFSSKHSGMMFDKESCLRRWTLLDLSAEEENNITKDHEPSNTEKTLLNLSAEENTVEVPELSRTEKDLLDLSAEENTVAEAPELSSTAKALSYFSKDGARKSIEEIRLGDNDSPALMSPALPDMDNSSDEEVDTVMHRGELWESLQSSN